MASQAPPSESINFLMWGSFYFRFLETDLKDRPSRVVSEESPKARLAESAIQQRGVQPPGNPARKEQLVPQPPDTGPVRKRGIETRAAGPRQPHLRTDLALLGLSVIWGVNFSVIKIALREFEPLAFNALRFVLASSTLFVFLRLRGPVPLPARRHWIRIVSLGLLANVVYQLLFIYGVDRTLAGNAGLVLATTPVWTLILASVTGSEHHGVPVWGGVLATLGGMVLVVVAGDVGVGWGEGLLMGDLLLVLASITWAAYTVGTQNLTREYGALAVTSWTLWVGTLGLVAISATSLWSTEWGLISWTGWLGAVYSGVLAIAVAYLIWNHGLEHIGGPRTAAFSNLVPVVALIAAVLWLGEDLRPTQIAGAIIIIAGVWIARVAGGDTGGKAVEEAVEPTY